VEIESVVDHSTDPVSTVLKWILLAVAIATFAVLAWTIGVKLRRLSPRFIEHLFPGKVVMPR
jgi:hypothetical protein